MLKSKASELEEYVRRLGETINLIHSNVNENKIKIKEITDALEQLKVETQNNTHSISNLKTSSVHRSDFDEFVIRLTDSLKNLLPSTASSENGENEEE